MKWFTNIFSKKEKKTMTINVTKEVTQKTTKTIRAGDVVVDSKTGEKLEYVGKVTSKSFDCPFVFVAINQRPTDNNSRRHSLAYVTKYIA